VRTIPKPGDIGGPCIEPCGHAACAAQWRIANTVCEECREPIGFGRPYFLLDDLGPFHAVCVCKETA
jgi:hypothetical protein